MLGADHPTTLSVREHLASLLALNGRYDESLQASGRVIEDLVRVHGTIDRRTLSARTNRGATLLVAGHVSGAVAQLKDVVADFSQSPTAGERTTLRPRRLLALAYRADARREEARDVLEPLLFDCERLLGAGAPLTRDVRTDLADLHTFRGPYVAASGSFPAPWVWVVDGRRSDAERFGPPRPRRGRVSSHKGQPDEELSVDGLSRADEHTDSPSPIAESPAQQRLGTPRRHRIAPTLARSRCV